MVGITALSLIVLVSIKEWVGDYQVLTIIRLSVAVFLMALITPQARRGRQVFVFVGLFLSLALMITEPEMAAQNLGHAIENAAVVGAYFCALSALQFSASRAPSVRNAGQFIASQPPGKRYLALTFGTQVFSTLLGYGSISLLGGLATAYAKQEKDLIIRLHRTRRMLVAIQRGFVSVLPWSPLSFSIVVIISLIPSVSWSELALPGLISSLILASVGLALDALFKPRLAQHVTASPPAGTWFSLLPLGMLFILLATIVMGLYFLTGVRVVGIVLVVVPFVALIWLGYQNDGQDKGISFRKNLPHFIFEELPSYRNELVLLMMAGFIGTVGSPLMSPMLVDVYDAISVLPAWVALIGVLWIIPICGQLGMNPILVVALLVPLLPSPEVMGYSPSAFGVALTSGWALSGATSPFTANTVLIGRMGNVSARHVGLYWNGPYALVSGCLLSIWVILFSMILS